MRGTQTPIIRHVLRHEKRVVADTGIIGGMTHTIARQPRALLTEVCEKPRKLAATHLPAESSRIARQIATASVMLATGLVVGTATAAPGGMVSPTAPKPELSQATGVTYPHEGTLAAAPVDSKTATKAQAAVPVATDFAAHARRAASLDAPLIVLVSLRDCVYCGPIRQRELAPLVRSGKYEVREIGMDSRAPVRDFDGSTTTGVAWARAHGVKVSPTVLFLDTSGRPVADPLIGAGLPDFYGAYLDDAIARARARLHGGSGATTR